MHAAPCDVEIQSVGFWESESTYVKLNGNFALELISPADENDRDYPSGTYTVLLDKVTHVPPYSISSKIHCGP